MTDYAGVFPIMTMRAFYNFNDFESNPASSMSTSTNDRVICSCFYVSDVNNQNGTKN